MPRTSFLTDIQTLRERAREHIDESSVTAGYSADREVVLELLADLLVAFPDESGPKGRPTKAK